MTIRAGAKQAFASQFKLEQLSGSTFDLVTLYEVPYSNGLVAKVEVVTTGTVDTYTGLCLTIISPKLGTLDKKLFLFNDYLSIDPKDRVDTRPDYKDGFYACASHDFEWYIAKPKSVEPLTTAVRTYIEHFSQE